MPASYNSAMSTILLRNGRVIDPSQNLDTVADLWLQDGRVLGLGSLGAGTPFRTLDCTGKHIPSLDAASLHKSKTRWLCKITGLARTYFSAKSHSSRANMSTRSIGARSDGVMNVSAGRSGHTARRPGVAA